MGAVGADNDQKSGESSSVTERTSASSDIHIHERSPLDGDVILYADDEIGVRFLSYHLRAYSAIFLELLDSKCDVSQAMRVQSPPSEPIGYELLIILSRVLRSEHVDMGTLPFEYMLGRIILLDFCDLYKMPHIHHLILLDTAAHLVDDDSEIPHFDLFVRAAKYDDVSFGALIIMHQDYSNQSDHSIDKFRPWRDGATIQYSGRRVLYKFKNAELVGGKWMLAMYLAYQRCVEDRHPDNWKAYAGHFAEIASAQSKSF